MTLAAGQVVATFPLSPYIDRNGPLLANGDDAAILIDVPPLRPCAAH
jgi:hypothetical protein